MGKEWLKVVGASLFEMVWVTGLAHSNNFFEWLLTSVGVVASFYLLTSAIKKLPIGTVYAIFAGLGSIGSILVGVIFFGEHIDFLKVFFMGTLIIGILGLKLIETETQKNNINPSVILETGEEAQAHSSEISNDVAEDIKLVSHDSTTSQAPGLTDQLEDPETLDNQLATEINEQAAVISVEEKSEKVADLSGDDTSDNLLADEAVTASEEDLKTSETLVDTTVILDENTSSNDTNETKKEGN